MKRSAGRRRGDAREGNFSSGSRIFVAFVTAALLAAPAAVDAATERAKLTASGGAAGNFFGRSVAAHGETVVVGAPGDDVGANLNQGSAYVYVGLHQ